MDILTQKTFTVTLTKLNEELHFDLKRYEKHKKLLVSKWVKNLRNCLPYPATLSHKNLKDLWIDEGTFRVSRVAGLGQF